MSKWISVSEALPENNESVIACRKGAGVGNFYINNDSWYQDGWGDMPYDSYSDITHRMPLPEPPKQ